MEEELLTFKKFRDADIAKDIAQKLHESAIYYEMENDKVFFDPTFANNPMQNEIRIKIGSADFPKAHKALEDYYDAQIPAISSDHYLFDFTDTELFDILKKPDEWGELDGRLAKKILIDRGYEITPIEIQSLKKQRNTELAKPEKAKPGFIIGGYISVIFGGIFGIIMGWILAYSKRTLPNGETVFTYVKSDRMHGKIISVLGVIFLIFAFWQLYDNIH